MPLRHRIADERRRSVGKSTRRRSSVALAGDSPVNGGGSTGSGSWYREIQAGGSPPRGSTPDGRPPAVSNVDGDVTFKPSPGRVLLLRHGGRRSCGSVIEPITGGVAADPPGLPTPYGNRTLRSRPVDTTTLAFRRGEDASRGAARQVMGTDKTGRPSGLQQLDRRFWAARADAIDESHGQGCLDAIHEALARSRLFRGLFLRRLPVRMVEGRLWSLATGLGVVPPSPPRGDPVFPWGQGSSFARAAVRSHGSAGLFGSAAGAALEVEQLVGGREQQEEDERDPDDDRRAHEETHDLAHAPVIGSFLGDLKDDPRTRPQLGSSAPRSPAVPRSLPSALPRSCCR
jgi:hypothetical protein